MVGYGPRVTIDNTDTRIQWIGQWFRTQGNTNDWGQNGPPFLETLQAITQNGSLSFSFRGSDVNLWGSIRVTADRDPDWDCLIDGNGNELPWGYPNVTGELSNYLLCRAEKLSDERNHTLQLIARVRTATLYVDTVQYKAVGGEEVPDAWMEVQQDDERFEYSDGWDLNSETSTRSTTTHGASVVYEFDGEAVIFQGSIPGSDTALDGLASYAIDKEPPKDFTIPATSTSKRNQVYFNRTDLKPGRHRLKLTNKGNASTKPLAFVSMYTKNAPYAPNKSKTIGGAAGGAGVALVVTLALLFFYWRRSRARSQVRRDETSLEPFPVASVQDGSAATPTTLSANVSHSTPTPTPIYRPIHKPNIQSNSTNVNGSWSPGLQPQQPTVQGFPTPPLVSPLTVLHQFPSSSGLASSWSPPGSHSVPSNSPPLSQASSSDLDPRFYPLLGSPAPSSEAPPSYTPSSEPLGVHNAQPDLGNITYFSGKSR